MVTSLLGCWKFTGSKMTDVRGRSLPDPLNQASGMIIYTPKYMAVQLGVPRGDTMHDEGSKMQADYISYYGSYAFDQAKQIVTHHVQSSNIPAMVGKHLPRKVKKINALMISLANSEPENFAIDTMIYIELFWEQVDVLRG